MKRLNVESMKFKNYMNFLLKILNKNKIKKIFIFNIVFYVY